jgi:hypothetical protein
VSWRYEGDDAYSWAVLLDGRPIVTGLTKPEVLYYRRLVAQVEREVR